MCRARPDAHRATADGRPDAPPAGGADDVRRSRPPAGSSPLVEARARLREVREQRLAVELGGAAGTLAALGDARRSRCYACSAEELEPRRAGRSRGTRTACGSRSSAARSIIAGGRGAKIGARRGAARADGGRRGARSPRGKGGSSTMPHKRNPVGSDARRLACAAAGARQRLRAHRRRSRRSTSARRAPGRPSGRRSPTRSRSTGGAGGAVREALAGLEVDAERMRGEPRRPEARSWPSRPVVPAQRRSSDARRAHELVGAALLAAAASIPSGTALLADGAFGLSAASSTARSIRPRTLGSAERFVDRALQRYLDELGAAA